MKKFKQIYEGSKQYKDIDAIKWVFNQLVEVISDLNDKLEVQEHQIMNLEIQVAELKNK